MNEIIQIVPQKIGDQEQNVVSARELHKALGLAKSQFTRWIKSNLLENLFFAQNIDFITARHDVEQMPKMFVSMEDYLLTIETAKHLTMLSRTKKAHEIREYFIQAEEKYRELLKADSQSDCWKDVRNDGKSPRRAVTDSIDRLVKNALANESKNAKNYYRSITLETYRGLALINTNKDFSLATVDLKSYRDNLSKDELHQLAVVESAISKLIDHELEVGTFYKDIFKKIKAKIDQFENFLLS